MTRSAQSRLRLLVIGVGSIGERHLRCVQNLERCDLAFCEPHAELREEISDRYNVEETYAELESAMENHFDVAIIAAPAHLHVSMAQTLADHGIHMLIEKPLSLSMDGIEQLQTTVARHGIISAVGFSHRANPLVTDMREFVQSGKLGRIVEMRIVCGHHFPTHRPAYADVYFNDYKTGGGAINDMIPHLYNAGEWLAGPITKIVVDADHLRLDRVTVEDTVNALARHDDVMATYATDLHQPSYELTIHLVCENGECRVDYHMNRWAWMDEPEGTWTEGAEKMSLERDDMFMSQDARFLDAVDGKGEVLCTLDEGIQTLKTTLASHESWRDGKWVEIG